MVTCNLCVVKTVMEKKKSLNGKYGFDDCQNFTTLLLWQKKECKRARKERKGNDFRGSASFTHYHNVNISISNITISIINGYIVTSLVRPQFHLYQDTSSSFKLSWEMKANLCISTFTVGTPNKPTRCLLSVLKQ